MNGPAIFRKDRPIHQFDSARAAVVFTIIPLLIGTLALFLQSESAAQTGLGLMWMFACLTAGAAIGFLFAVPKILQAEQPSSDTRDPAAPLSSSYHLQVNTNLTEISDWLTKIIVGLGLINLTKMPGNLDHLARTLANGLKGAPNDAAPFAFAYGLIICFSISGFLFGYITTRLFLASAISRADQSALEIVRRQVSSAQTQIVALENSQAVLKSAYPYQSDAPSAAPEKQQMADSGISKLAQLEQMADEYMAIGAESWAERVRLKDDAAAQMARFAIDQGISKDEVTELAVKTRKEGVVVALATLVNFAPGPGDLQRLLRVSSGLTRLHVQYRVILAVGTLIRQALVEQNEKADVERLLQQYEQGADSALAALIQDTLALIDAQLK